MLSYAFLIRRVIQTRMTAPTKATMIEPIMPPLPSGKCVALELPEWRSQASANTTLDRWVFATRG